MLEIFRTLLQKTYLFNWRKAIKFFRLFPATCSESSRISSMEFFSKITILFNRYLSFQKSSIIYIRLSSKYTSDSIHPSRLFFRENNTNFQVLPNGRKILYPWYNIKKKSTYILLPFSINSNSFATAFRVLVITSFSLYPLSCLWNSTRYCFTFSHNLSYSSKVSAAIMCLFVPLYHFICKNFTANDSCI